jgi:hypothetical protein
MIYSMALRRWLKSCTIKFVNTYEIVSSLADVYHCLPDVDGVINAAKQEKEFDL